MWTERKTPYIGPIRMHAQRGRETGIKPHRDGRVEAGERAGGQEMCYPHTARLSTLRPWSYIINHPPIHKSDKPAHCSEVGVDH